MAAALAPTRRDVAPPAYRRHAGHAAHFLQRLDRVDDRQAELALALYNDPALVRAALACASLPDQAERVAISLEHPTKGPFLIVTREGRFVTCLGRGMCPRHPVITRAQLDAAGRKVGRLREILAQATTVIENPGRVRSLLHRVLDGCEHVSREEIGDLLRWEPLLGSTFVVELGKCASQLLMAAPTVRNILRPRAKYEGLLYAYHRALYGLGHLYVLAGASEASVGVLDDMVAKGPLGLSLSAFGFSQDVAYLSARAMWATARWPGIMPAQREMLSEPGNAVELADGYFGVAAIGLACQARRAEARKAIERARPSEPRLAEAAAVLRGHLSMCFTNQQDVHDWGMARARMRLSLRVPGLREEDVTEADARAWSASAPGHAVRTPDEVGAFATALPCIVRAAPEELYLPARVIEQLRTPWRMEKTIALLAGHRDAYGVQRPVRVLRTAGRNDRCPCGSGRKLKRCCPGAGRELRLLRPPRTA